ncbi:MAG: Hsp20/alpha crystallin family protein [Candidatus Bathyarchaeia archaeon]
MYYSRRKKTIFDTIEALRKEMDRIFEEYFEALTPETSLYDFERRGLTPLTEVRELEDEIVVKVDLPRVSREDIKIQANENELKIEAPLTQRYKPDLWSPFCSRVEFDGFRKVIPLPAPVDPNRARAKFKDGILQVRLPKKITGTAIPVE